MKKLLILLVAIVIFVLVVICGFRIVQDKPQLITKNIVAIEPIYSQGFIENKPTYKNLGIFKITAYCSCNICSEGWGTMTTSGKQAQANHTVAAPPNIPFGTKLLINGTEYVVEDRGGAIKGNRIDIYFDSHQEALNWGVKNIEVLQIIE